MPVITEESVLDFEQQLWTDEKSEATIDKYGSVLRSYTAWLAGEEITREKMLEYRDFLCRTLSPQTVNNKLSAIDSYLNFIGRRDLQIRHLKVQKNSFREPDRAMTREDYDRMVETAKKEGKDRLVLILETICSTGIRVSELRFITAEAVRRKKAVVHLKGKVRTVLMTKELVDKLREYAKEQNITSGEIFLTRNGRPLSRQQIWAEMKALCKAAGVAPSKVYPHNLRHLFAQLYYEADKDIEELADVLGHSSIDTTRIYLLSTGEKHILILESLCLVS